LFRDFGRLYTTWLYHRLKDPAYAFLYEAFSDYLRKRYAGGYLQRGYLPYRGRRGQLWQEQAYVPIKHVIKTLHITGGTVEKLIDQGLLRMHKKAMGKKGKKSLTLIEWSSVEELREEWGKFVTLESVAKEFLGLRSAALSALMDADILVPTRGPKIDGYSTYLYRKTDVEQFVDALLQMAVKEQVPPLEGIYLSQTGRWLGGKLTLATTITAILRGHLIPIDLDNGRPLFQRLFLTAAEMNLFREKRERWRYEKLGWLTVQEAAASLGVYEEVLLRWMQDGLITGERQELDTVSWRSRIIFTRESLETFRQTYAFTEEVATLFGVTPSTIERYVCMDIIHPVVGRKTHRGGGRMLFLREEIELLIPPGSLGIREVMTLLGASENRICGLVSTRQLPCIYSPSGYKTPVRFLRSELDTYLQCQVDMYQQLLTKLSSECVEGDDSCLLTSDVAALMGVSVRTVGNWIRQKQLPAKKGPQRGAISTYHIGRENLARFVQKLLEEAEQVMARVRTPDQDTCELLVHHR
jgi:DNA-binding transcriptional MerR regulator